MKLTWKTFIYLFVGVMVMINANGCSSEVRLDKYSSKDPALNISMNYISGWRYNECRCSYDSYAQVLFYPFGGKNKSLAVMVVTVKNSSKISLSPLNLETVVDDLLAKRMKFKDAAVLSKSNIQFLNMPATSIELTYKTLENFLNVHSKLIPVKEKIIVFKKGENFYFLRYQNSAVEFDKYSKAFDRILKTFRFKD